MSTGYSGTPLVQKLGIKPGQRVLVYGSPRDYREVVPDLPSDVEVLGEAAEPVHMVHAFLTRGEGLRARLEGWRAVIRPDGAVWVSWPKKAARVPTDLTEDVVRDAALAAGLVDVKVCAVDEVWSGLKLVIRVRDR